MPRAVAEKRLMCFALELLLFRRVGLGGLIKGYKYLFVELYIKAYALIKPTYSNIIRGYKARLRCSGGGSLRC